MVTAESILKRAKEINSDIVNFRRTIHKNPETGACLPETKEYVKKCLDEMGYKPEEICESGIVATVTGKDTGRCILLRADMDGLKIEDKTDLDFKSENGCMHACGHDMHTAMLLGAAKLLKEYESELEGTVKLVFQPDEEGFTGAKTMLKAGVLENPAPQAGFALHVNSGTPSGLVIAGRGTFMAGCTLFRIRVKGVGCHGAMPENGVDPIFIAVQIYNAIEQIKAREIVAKNPVVVTCGKFSGGKAPNIIPDEVVMEGTIRTFDKDLSAHILERIGEIAEGVAKALKGSAQTEEISSAPPLINNPELVNQMKAYAGEIAGEKMVYAVDEGGMGSEDFSSYTYEIPCSYLLIGAGTKEENPLFGKPMHNEKIVFNEDILATGTALHTYCAIKWLADKK